MVGGARAAPIPPPASGMLEASARLLSGIQLAMMRLKHGQAAASPTPRQNRATSSEVSAERPSRAPMLVATAVSAVKLDHQTMAAVNTRRGPKRSASHPPGTWKNA